MSNVNEITLGPGVIGLIQRLYIGVPDHMLTLLSRAVFRARPRDDLERLGSEYGGWIVPTSLLSADSVCWCAGVGEDITFDLELIRRFDCHVWAVDPTPRAALHVQQVAADEPRYHYLPVGLWHEEAVLRFYAPADPDHVSHSILNLQKTDSYFEARCLPLHALMADAGHDHVDLLKMNIEGAGHAVLDNLLCTGLKPRIVAVELDRPWRRVLRTVRDMRDAGYTLVSIKRWNYCFVLEGSSRSTSRPRRIKPILTMRSPPSHRVGVTAGLVRRLLAVMEVERDAEDERGESDVPAA